MPVALPFIQDRRIKALAVTSAQRSPALPDVPTVAEALNLPKYQSLTWFGMFAPAGTPEPILQRLHTTVQQALRTPEISQQIRDAGIDPSPVAGKNSASGCGTKLNSRNNSSKQLAPSTANNPGPAQAGAAQPSHGQAELHAAARPTAQGGAAALMRTRPVESHAAALAGYLAPAK